MIGVTSTMNAQATTRATFSLPSILAIVAAIGSFASGALWGFVLGMAAVILGVIGVIIAFAPGVRGGFVSTFAVIAGILGFIAAVVKGVAWLL